MMKEYISNFSYLSIAVMVLFFILFWFLVYQTLKIGQKKSVEFSNLPIETDTDFSASKNQGGDSNG